jgi:hypothetical protein
MIISDPLSSRVLRQLLLLVLRKWLFFPLLLNHSLKPISIVALRITLLVAVTLLQLLEASRSQFVGMGLIDTFK